MLWKCVFSGVMCQPSVYSWRSYANRCLPRRAGYVQHFWIFFLEEEKKWSFILKFLIHRTFYWLSPRHSMERGRYPRRVLTHQHCCLRQGVYGLVRAMLNLWDTKLPAGGRMWITPWWSRRLDRFSSPEKELGQQPNNESTCPEARQWSSYPIQQ